MIALARRAISDNLAYVVKSLSLPLLFYIRIGVSVSYTSKTVCYAITKLMA